MKSRLYQYALKMTAMFATLAVLLTVNSSCNILVYEPEMPESAKRLIKQ